MDKNHRKAGHAGRFQWLRDIRSEMSREMAAMTPEERTAYIHAGAEKELAGLRRFTPEEAKMERDRILCASESRKMPISVRKARPRMVEV